ncbi:MAG: ATP phosphoribosyltransferase regulatory subunit [Clostridia bacterium]|nr:ATP phosphoribosyltransferase regulatory subunit [Clostridia bacterium]
MKKYSKITPEGTKDLLFEECLANRTVSSILGNVFSHRGFHEVLTPGIEFYDLFSESISGIPMEYMFKMSDSKGRLMVMRPDSTLPIARMVTTRLKNEPHPLRLYYNQRVYRYNPGLTGRSNEVMQTGIELIGAKGKRADLEVITTAIEALSKCVPDFRIELGHAGFFKALAQKLPVSDSEREDIRFFIESKNYSALNSALDSLEQTQAVNVIRKLPRLFGGIEVLDEAYALCDDEDALKALDYVREIYNDLSKYHLGDRLIIDLGLVQRNDYYSNIVFSGYVEGSGEPVLIGGRYDNLLDSFDAPAAAIGFGINVDSLSRVMLSRGNIPQKKKPDILVHSAKGYEIEAIKYNATLAEANILGENSVFETEQEALEYAKSKGIKKLTVVGEEIKTINTGV